MTQTRREFLKHTSAATLAVWLGFSTKGYAGIVTDIATAKNFTPYIMVESTGAITIFNIKPEMGQGTFQSVPALLAEEFEVSLSQVTIKNTNGEKQFGKGQGAGGSSSIRTNYTEFRKMGASAKEVFITAAATKWGVDAASCYAENGTVIHKPTMRTASYGSLVEEAAKLDLPKEPKLKDPKDFKIVGKMKNRPDVPMKTNGKAVFGIDAQVEGMVYATIERCPVIGGTLRGFDAAAALAMPGVQKVVEVERIMGRHHSTGVAVIANSYWNATQARAKLKIEWDTKGFEKFNSTQYEEQLRKLAKEPGVRDKNIGDVDAVTILPKYMMEAFYETPMVAHHAMEPMSCIAQVRGDKLELWTSTQLPGSLTGDGANDLHSIIGFKPDNIQLHSMFIGGGFGRRLYSDYVIEAVNIAKQVSQPVKLIWSREDTTMYGPYRPMTFSQMKGGLSEDGKLISFQHKVVSPSYAESMNDKWDKSKVDGTMVEGIGEQPYEIPNLRTAFVRADYHVPLAAWRSVTSSTVAFPHECFIDELAYKAGKDPMAFRLSMLEKSSDFKKVLLKIKEVSQWDTALAKGRGRGVAIWQFFAGLCAQVVEVTYRADKSITVDKVYAVIDLGEVVNPDNVKNQVEGSVVMALGAAVKPGIMLENGQVTHHNFYDSPLIRINEVPEVEVVILADGGKVKGVGEPGLPPFAPALANAIFAATGKRIRKMPFNISKV